MRTLLAAALGLSLAWPSVWASPSPDPIDEINRQRAFVNQTLEQVEEERLQTEIENRAESRRRSALEKQRVEAKLAVQLSGLSGRLSGLPEMPSFSGKLETQGEDPKLKTAASAETA